MAASSSDVERRAMPHPRRSIVIPVAVGSNRIGHAILSIASLPRGGGVDARLTA